MDLERSSDVVIVGGGHNGLVAAAYLARAGRSVLVLERLDHLGGAAVSQRPFAGVDARLSRYSYLVSLLPTRIVSELGLRFRTAHRRISSYTPVPGTDGGVLVDTGDGGRTRASMRALTGSDAAFASWQELYARTAVLARAVAPTLLEPLVSADELRRRVGDDAAWSGFVERPLGETIEETLGDDVLRGIALTDALIGTFAAAHDPAPTIRRTCTAANGLPLRARRPARASSAAMDRKDRPAALRRRASATTARSASSSTSSPSSTR